MVEVIRAFCWHQKFVIKGFSVLAIGLYTCIKSLKMCIKSDFEWIILKLATYGQREKAFCYHPNFVCPCPGAIYMYKSIKIYTRTRCQVSVYRTTKLSPYCRFPFKSMYNSINLGKFYKPSKQPFLMHQSDRQIQKFMMLNYLKQKSLII